MFIHQNQLRHLLQPDQYTSSQHYQRELDRLFWPVWHPVASTAELARPGDFLTMTLFERPLLLRNCDGKIQAYLNVCPHRHSALTDKLRGHSPRFYCQYHGWEYQADGRTAKIPDARAFRPWDRENSRLVVYPTELCGGLIFVRLSAEGPTLREFLAPLWQELSQGFAAPYCFAGTWEADFPCNWKVVLENSLESYHIPEVHPKTFKTYPDEPECEHELQLTHSIFKTQVPRDVTAFFQDWMVRRLGQPVTREYSHQVLHPHLTFNRLDVYRMVQCVFPTGPQSCRYRAIMYSLAGPKRNLLARLIAWGLRPLTVAVAKKIFAEDGSIYAGVQKGLQASPHPGVIGTREERIYAFQQYILAKCQSESPLQTSQDNVGDGSESCLHSPECPRATRV
jgi:phenylpropionate dioxygenase-like ring-hydroxylating dioxygenase large terminal subunit